MMNGIVVYKMSGSGNDFVFIDGRTAPVDDWAAEHICAICDRKNGVGADGFAVLAPGSAPGRVRFHFFNNDGRRAPMCGNGSLCATRVARWLELVDRDEMILETDAGDLRTEVLGGTGQRAALYMEAVAPASEPKIALQPGEKAIHLCTVAVPHVVAIVDDVDSVPLAERGRELRAHPSVGPDGSNVNFVSQTGESWAMRTYERGVEAETLACGTGAVACAMVLAARGEITLPWEVRTASCRTLSVAAELTHDGGLRLPRLVGEARLVYRAILVSDEA